MGQPCSFAPPRKPPRPWHIDSTDQDRSPKYKRLYIKVSKTLVKFDHRSTGVVVITCRSHLNVYIQSRQGPEFDPQVDHVNPPFLHLPMALVYCRRFNDKVCFFCAVVWTIKVVGGAKSFLGQSDRYRLGGGLRILPYSQSRCTCLFAKTLITHVRRRLINFLEAYL